MTDTDGETPNQSANHDPARLTSRSIRSFVVRNGRQTPAQADALERLLPTLGIGWQHQSIDFEQVFGRRAPLWLEIGFGNGDALVHMARTLPDVDFIGIEVHAPGIGHALLRIEAEGLNNVRVIHHDAVEVLEHMIPPASLEKIVLLFADPWHKKRHHKRRIVQTDFIKAVVRCLSSTGQLHCATDWADYAQWMLDVIDAEPDLSNLSTDTGFVPRPEWRMTTRFERRGQRLGHEVFDLLYQRC